MTNRNDLGWLALLVLTVCALLAAATLAAPAMTFTTLGANSGPIPNSARSEPASLVRYGDQAILVDVGDGATEQLARAGVGIAQVQTIVSSIPAAHAAIAAHYKGPISFADDLQVF